MARLLPHQTVPARAGQIEAPGLYDQAHRTQDREPRVLGGHSQNILLPSALKPIELLEDPTILSLLDVLCTPSGSDQKMSPSSTSDSNGESYLNDDLLGGGDVPPLPRPKAVDVADYSLPKAVGVKDLGASISAQTKGQTTAQTSGQKGSVRLVIGIDYGTTFTGEFKISMLRRIG